MPLLLRVVYAGRGDAFVLEDGGRNELWLIDGGPLGWSAEGGGRAPYYEYLAEAVKKAAAALGQRRRSAILSGIVISHAHEDHYGGVVELLSGVGRIRAVAKLEGPLITQPLDEPRQDGQEALRNLVKALNYVERAGAAPEVLGPFGFGSPGTFPRLIFDRRAAEARRWLEPLAKTWTVDTSADNLRSVLMLHVPGRIVFTGDSVGAKVEPFVAQVAQNQQPLWVFKVPHHGSLRNSQRITAVARVPQPVQIEYALLCIMLDPREWNGVWHVPKKLQEYPGSMAVAREILEELCGGANYAKLEGELRTAVAANLRAAATGGNFQWQTVDTVVGGFWKNLTAELVARAIIGVDDGQSVARRKRGHDELLEGVSGSWAWALESPKVLSEPYLAELAFAELKAFYAGFSAYNYVISADGSHRHPAAETIAAIAATRSAAAPTARVFVTDASSIDLQRIANLAGPGWQEKIDLRALASGTEIPLDLSNQANVVPPNPATPPPGTACAIDPGGKTRSVATIAEPNRTQLHEQLQGGSHVKIPDRTVNRAAYQVRIPGPAPTYLNLNRRGEPSVVNAPMSFQVEEAWAQQPPQADPSIVRLVGSPGGKRLVRMESRGTRWALRLNPNAPADEWVSTQAPSYRTTNPFDPNLALFEFAKVALPEEADADLAGQPAASAATEPTLRAFLEAAGLLVDPPLSGRAALVALVGPAAAATIVAETKLPVLGRPFAWEADLDASAVTWSSDPAGLLVEAATIVVKVGSNDTFTIEGTPETIVSAWLRLERGEGLAATVGLKTAEGTELDHTATIAAPGRGRPLAEYLGEVGVAAGEQDEVIVADLLGRMLGSRSLVEDLLMNGPSFIAAAGLGVAKLDLEASEVETFASPTGGLDVVGAQLVTEQAAIAAKVAGLALTLEDLALTVGAPQVLEKSVVLTGAATITPAGNGAKPVPLAAGIALTEDRPELTLSLAAGATLSQVVALLPGAPTLGNLEVPVVGGTLGAVTLSSLGLTLRQPVEDADAYVVSSVFGAIQFDGWAQVLPPGFPAVTSGRVELRVFDPEDAVQRRVGFEGEATFQLASKRSLTAAVGVWPMAGPGDTTAVEPGYSKTVTVHADPETGPVTLAEIVTAFGLPSTASVPAPLAELLDSVALERIAIELADAAAGGTEVAAFEIALALAKEWTPLSGFSLTAGLLDLRYDGTEWSGEVAATMLLAETIAIEAGYVVPTATTSGSFTFAPVGALNLKEAAEGIGLGALGGVPLLGSLLETVSVTEVLVTLAAGTTKTPTITSYSLSLLLDTIALGRLTVDGVGLDLTRTVPADGEEAQTLLWIEAEFGDGAAILEAAWDSAEGKLGGSLRMLETRTLNQMLAALLGDEAPANVLLPLVGEVAVIGAEVEFETESAKLKSFRLELDTSKVLKLGTAGITTLGIAFEAGETAAEPKRYALTGKLRGPSAGADIEVGCMVKPESTVVVASVKGVAPEVLTLEGLVSLLLPSNPTVPPLAGAPDFLEIEVTEVSAELSYSDSELGLEALRAKVRSETAITLLATSPPLVLEELSLAVAYEKKPSPAVTGTIFGKLTVPSTPTVTVELEYSLDREGVGVFAGGLTVAANPPEFGKLLEGGPFDPGVGGGVPAGIGLPTIPMAELSVRVEMPPKPKPLSVTVSGYARPTEWKRETLGIDFAAKELGGSVTVTGPAAGGGSLDYACSLFGVLSFGAFVGRATLAFGAREDTVLTAVTTEAKAVSLGEVAGMLSGGGEAAWTEVVPTGTAALGFEGGSKGYAYLNFTAESFALLGSLAGFGVGALVSHPGPAGTHSFAFLAALSGSPSKPFRFANLWTELGSVDAYLAVRVANLALIDYSGGVADLEADIAAVERAAAAEGVALEAPFKGLDWLGEPGIGPNQLTKGGAFFADLALSPEATLSHNLEAMVDEPGKAAAIALYALVDHAEPKNTIYAGTITDLTLLGGSLVLAGALTYRPKAAVTQLEAAGSLTLKLEPAEAGYKFEGKLTLGTDKATFAASTTGTPIKIEDPFGGMFGLSIGNARLDAEFDFEAGGTTKSTIALSGEVEFKVVVALRLTASIVFVSGSPVLAKIELPGTLSFDELLRGIGLPWPTDYEVLTLENGSMYYAPAAVMVGGVPYEEGYHLATTAKVLGQAIGIGVEVASDGIVAQAVVEAGFDFGFLQLTGYEESGHTFKGPFVRISTRGTAAFTVGAGVSLFRTPLASTTVTYKPTLSKWLGSVTVPALEGSTVEFTWSEADGFRLTNLELLSEVIEWAELAEQLISASSKSECGAIVGLAWDTLVETKAHAEFTQAGAVTAAGLPFAIKGKFDLMVAGATIVTVPLPPLEGIVPTPDSFQLSAVPAWLTALLRENLAKMAVSLWEHKEELIKLIAVLVGVTAAREGLVALICNDIETPNVGEDVVESVDNGVTEAAEGAGEVATEAAAALGAEGMADAATATAAAATALVGLGLLVAGVVRLIESATPWLGEEVSGKKKPVEAEGEKGRAELAKAEARMQELLTMAGAPTATFAAANRVAVAWTDADRPTRANFDYEGYAGFTWQAQVSTTPDFSPGVSAEVPGSTSPIEVELPALASVNNGYARIRAVYAHGGKEWKGPWKEAAAPAFHTVPLAAPASVTQALTADGDTIAVTVAPVASATAYTVTLVDPTKPTVVLLHQQVRAPATGPAVASLDTRLLPDTVGTGASLVAVAVAEGDPTVHAPSPPTTSAPLPTQAPLSVPTVTVEADGLHVTWPVAQTTPRPEVRVEVGGALLSPQPAVLAWDADGKGCLLGVEGIASGQAAGVEMRLPDPAHVALWSSPPATVTVPMLAAPGHFAALFDCAAAALAVSWDEDAAATGWAVECRAAGGGALSPAPTVTAGKTGATVSGPAVAAGHSYEARARGLRSGSVSVWSEWVEVSAAAVGAVAGVTFAVAGSGLEVAWEAYPAADLYRVGLLVPPARTVAAEASPEGVSASFPLKAPLAPEAEGEASVRALVGTSLGPAGTARLTTPPLLGLVEAARAGSLGAAEAAAAARAYKPTLGFAELLVTLVAAGYSTADAEAATLADFPGSNLAPLVAALHTPALLAPLLTAAPASLPTAVTVRLAAKLYAGKAVELAIQLRLGGVAQAAVAAALPGAYPGLTPASAEAIAAAAYVEPWALGAQLFAGAVAEAAVVPDLLDAYPGLGVMRAMASLNASYAVANDADPVGAALVKKYPDDWGEALGALMDPSGVAMAKFLKGERVSRQEATSYVAAAIPALPEPGLKEAIEAAYGPSG